MDIRILPVHRHIRRFQQQAAPRRHRVPGVQAQVHDHLLDLAAVKPGGRQPLVQGCLNLYVFPDHLLNQLPHLGDHDVQIEVHRVDHLSPGEGQQLPCQRSRMLGAGIQQI